MRSFWKKHPVLVCFFALTLLCTLLFFLFRLCLPLAEWFARGPGSAFRFLLAAVSSPFPFSLFEISIGLFCLYLVFLLFFVPIQLFRRKRKNAPLHRKFYPMLLSPLLVLLSVFDLYCVTLAPCYWRTPTAQHMNLDLEGVDTESVFFALEELLDVINTSAPHLNYNQAGESIPPKPLSHIKKEVAKAADAFGTKNSFYQSKGFPAKSFFISPVMTYTHISGVYGFFTGEANVNTNYPHFIVTATLAHETCHARGIAPENECNFLAAVILMESDDPYLRYCGANFLADDFVSLCRKIDRERTSELLSHTAPVLQKDWAAYSRFFDPYRDSSAAKVADKTNSAYLQSMGQEEGTVSYSRIIRLTSAYFAQQQN